MNSQFLCVLSQIYQEIHTNLNEKGIFRMTYKYALEFDDRSIIGKNQDIKGAISIEFVNEPPSLINPESSSHAGMQSSSSLAKGDFSPEFIISDVGELEATNNLISLARKNTKEHKLKITCYSLVSDEGEYDVVEDYVIEFQAHFIFISFLDNKTSNKNHIFQIVSSKHRSEVVHDRYRLGSKASKMRSTLCDERTLLVDKEGQGIILSNDE